MRGLKFEFTEEQIEYIISNWGVESAHSMRLKFGCSWEAVCRVAAENGLDLPVSNIWTEEQIKQLKILSKSYHYKKIAKIMGKSENAIYLKARRMGIVLIQSGRAWTLDEEKMLEENWGYMKLERLAKKMKRTVFALKVKAARMGLGSMLENNSDIVTVSDISELTSVSRDRIMNSWVNLGLKLQQMRLTNSRTYYYVTWYDLLDFLEKNQNEWDSRNVDSYMLGTEPDWLRQKRKRDRLEDPLWYRHWTDEEKQKVVELLKIGKTYDEIALLVRRSEGAVAGMLCSLGYSYRLPQFWTGEELKFLKDNYLTMTYQQIAKHLNRTTKAVSSKAEELGYSKKYIRTRKKGKENG